MFLYTSSIVSIALIVELALSANAAVIERRDADCTPSLDGYLAADVSGTYKSFTINGASQVSYVGDSEDPLFVQFQACASLADSGPGAEIEQPGRIYVPSYDKCVAITNQLDETGPYFTTLADCNTLDPQHFLLRLNENNSIYWFGETDEEGTTPQGGCGLLGYGASSTGAPVTTGDNEIQIVCGGTPFKISDVPL